MMSIKTISLLTISFLAISVSSLCAQTTKKGSSAQDSIKRISDKMQNKQTYQLAYKLKKGEKIKFSTKENVGSKVQGGGHTTESESRGESIKTWKVINVDRLGNITFSLTLDSVNMWTRTHHTPANPKESPAMPVSYNSETDDKAPDKYKQTAEQVGKTLSVFSISPSGKILNRQSNQRENTFGASKVTIPLPEKAVPVGYAWNVPKLLQATDENGKNIQLKARVRYELARVDGHNAFLRFRTEILTPITSEKVKSTVMQKITKGEIAFDMAKGRPVYNQVRWNEKAQGFAGPDSLLEVIGNTTEKIIITETHTSASTSSLLSPIKDTGSGKPVEIKTHDGQPVMRR